MSVWGGWPGDGLVSGDGEGAYLVACVRIWFPFVEYIVNSFLFSISF